MSRAGQSPELADKLIDIFKKTPWRRIIFIFSIAAFLYVIALNFSSLQQGLRAIQDSNLLLLGASMAAICATYLTAAGVYWALSDKKIVYSEMLKVEIAGAFTSKLLPAGLGGVATNLTYISKSLKSKTAATTIIALNNIVSMASYFALTALILAVFQEPLRLSTNMHLPHIPPWFYISAVILIILTVSLVRQVRSKVGNSWNTIKQLLRGYRERPSQFIVAFCSALGTTVLYLIAFYLCCLALGTTISITQALLAFTLGLTGGTVAPTPGGLGGAEVGFYSGLYATGINGSEALSIVLVYRLLAFWIPLLPGFIMFRFLLKKKVL
jgi:uncharacterized membrane protein YbhN (UPF0104 family)